MDEPLSRHASPLANTLIVRNQAQAVYQCDRNVQLVRRVLMKAGSLQRRHTTSDGSDSPNAR
jgi:hypothetical protein